MRSDGLIEFVDAVTLTGPPLPARFQAKLWFHNEVLPDIAFVVVVTPRPTGPPRANILHIVYKDKTEACIKRSVLRELNVSLPSGSERRGDKRCFKV
jgi:hypothetical protein